MVYSGFMETKKYIDQNGTEQFFKSDFSYDPKLSAATAVAVTGQVFKARCGTTVGDLKNGIVRVFKIANSLEEYLNF